MRDLPLEQRVVKYEESIEWVAEPPGYLYEQVIMASKPSGPLRRNVGRLIAFAHLSPKATKTDNRYARRTWWVPSDPAHRPSLEAIDPSSVVVGKATRWCDHHAGGVLPRRYWGDSSGLHSGMEGRPRGEDRQRRLVQLQARLRDLREALVRNKEQANLLANIESRRPLTAEEHQEARSMRFEAERLRLELARLRDEFEPLRS